VFQNLRVTARIARIDEQIAQTLGSELAGCSA
jgi:hypothetical protein